MTIKEELIQYCKDCIDDKYVSEDEYYISCEKHKWACQRLLDDFKKEKCKNTLKQPFKYHWDEYEASQIVKWFTYLRHSKGVLAGKPIILAKWEKFILCQLYGWRRDDNDLKRFTKSFTEVARKNAKSQMEAGVALYEISVTACRNKELREAYCAGTKREQSEIIFNECKLMLRGSPLRGKFKITNKKITHIKSGSFLKALCKEDGKKGDGTNPAFLVLDEYHQHATTEFYDLGLGGAAKENVLMIITTAGEDLNVPCYTQEYEYCSNALDPEIPDMENDEYLIDILEMDEGDNIEDIRNWLKANPIRMSYKEGREKLIGDYKLAKGMPEKMVTFKTKCLDIWVHKKKNGYMDYYKWEKCRVEDKERERYLHDFIRGKKCFVGFDLSAKLDLTSVAFVIPYQSDELDSMGNKKVKFIIFVHSFIPNEEKLMERKAKGKVLYDLWAEDDKYITVTDSNVVDQSKVWNYVKGWCNSHGVIMEQLWFDPYNASKLMTDIGKVTDVPIFELYQSKKYLNEPTQFFREQVYDGNIEYFHNPVLDFAIKNCVTCGVEEIKIDKEKSEQKIDPVDAIICAIRGAMLYEFDDLDEYINSDEFIM